MINEDYVSFEVAKLLKEKGFAEKCVAYYPQCITPIKLTFGGRVNYNAPNKFKMLPPISAPTHQMAMKWLREHGLHINAPISYDYSVDADGNEVDRWTFYIFEIYSSFSGDLIYTEEVNEYDSYEDAIEAALKYSLINIV